MVRLAEEYHPSDYFYQQIGIAKAHIILVMRAYPNVPEKLKTMIQKSYDLLGEAKEFFDGCEMTVIPTKR